MGQILLHPTPTTSIFSLFPKLLTSKNLFIFKNKFLCCGIIGKGMSKDHKNDYREG